MGDAETMEALRQKRMSEMQQNQISKQKQQQEQARQQDEMKRTVLLQILTPEARERLSRIRLVKAEKADAIELMLIRAAQTGKLGGQVTDEYLVKMLEQLNDSQTTKAPKVIIQRRKGFDSDDD
eukprot:c3411_g1_i1.p1 GENE.c3411_g1_i1~~c3411_g1_i1.p1  ORF type:complete len:137 (+),score=46.69 c3411_g1_i1:41-412(+)